MSTTALHHEQALLNKIAKGDQHAFATVFNHYQSSLYLFSKRLTKSEEDALEVVQDVFLKIWNNRATLPQIDNFAAYLNRIVRNHSLNVLRKLARERKQRSWLEDHDEAIGESLIDMGTNKQLDYNDALRLLDSILKDLPTQQRQVYQLCHIEGLKYEEAAQTLGISTETVRVHMKRALQKIRAHFRQYAIFYPMLIIALTKY